MTQHQCKGRKQARTADQNQWRPSVMTLAPRSVPPG